VSRLVSVELDSALTPPPFSRFIVCCLEVLDGETVGKVLPGTGEAEFHLTYRALILKVFKDEVLDAKVTRVAPVSMFRIPY
jgi:DNA-directed RNA polymerase II subunit RPB7